MLIPQSKSNYFEIPPKLNFCVHIIDLEKTISRSLGMLSELKLLFKSALLNIYYAFIAFIYPCLLCGCTALGFTFPVYISELGIL